jgi:gliding motility-associated-like protein
MKNDISHFRPFRLLQILLLPFCAFFSSGLTHAQYCTPTYITAGTWVGFSPCGSSGTFPLGHLITNVTIGTINNTITAANCTTYNFSAQSTTVFDDGSCPATPMTVTVTGYSGVTVAVDLNNDFDFSDPGEIVIPNSYVATNPAVYNLLLPIPPGTSTGPHRMRVYNAGANATNSAGGACDNFEFGNFHDYTINVAHNPNPPTFQGIVNTTICHGQSFVYDGVTYTSSQQILDTLQTAGGCDSFLTINLTVAPIPVGTINQTICNGDIYNFGGQAYNTSGTYYDTLLAATSLGCDSVVILSLTVLPPVIIQTLTENICQGDSFLFAGNTYFTSGQYNDTLFSVIGCDSLIRALNLIVHSLPNVSISLSSSNTEFCIGDKVNLRADPLFKVEWHDVTNGSLVSSQTPFSYSIPSVTNWLYVKGTDANNCPGSDSIKIKAEACCEMQMPTAFSPNGDGLNDKFYPNFLREPRGYQMSIFNRFGQLVFKSYKVNDGWDGRSGNGQAVDAGTYFWYIIRNCAGGDLIEGRGDVTLLR